MNTEVSSRLQYKPGYWCVFSTRYLISLPSKQWLQLMKQFSFVKLLAISLKFFGLRFPGINYNSNATNFFHILMQIAIYSWVIVFIFETHWSELSFLNWWDFVFTWKSITLQHFVFWLSCVRFRVFIERWLHEVGPSNSFSLLSRKKILCLF